MKIKIKLTWRAAIQRELTFALPLFGSSGINNGLFSLLCTDLHPCQVTHTNTPSGQNISSHSLLITFYLTSPDSSWFVSRMKGIQHNSPISWSSLTLYLSLAKASNHLCLSWGFLQHSTHINSRVKAFRRRRAFLRVRPRSRSRPSGTSTTSVWSISSRSR